MFFTTHQVECLRPCEMKRIQVEINERFEVIDRGIFERLLDVRFVEYLKLFSGVVHKKRFQCIFSENFRLISMKVAQWVLAYFRSIPGINNN